MPRPVGRPTKLTNEVQEKILQAIRGGNYREVAARWAGIDPVTLTRWMRRGEQGRRGPYVQFCQAVLEAEQQAELRAVALIMKGAASDPNHAKWWLERKFHERWGRRERTEHTGADGGPVAVKVTFGGRYKPDQSHPRAADSDMPDTTERTHGG